MATMTMNKTALISVSNKTELASFSGSLEEMGFDLIATGKTATELSSAGIAVRSVDSLTGFPEILGGRVKTLHPKILGGILASPTDIGHRRDMNQHGIEEIGLVCVNLYPFEEMMEAREEEELLREFIDIGGVTLLRAAAKNYPNVIVVCDPKDYSWIIERLKSAKDLSLEERRLLAYKAFEHTANYDAAIASYFREHIPSTFPNTLTLRLKKSEELRYGENPHQKAALYTLPRVHGGLAHARALQGKQLSFNNYLDLEAAWSIVKAFDGAACAIVKHTSPCGVAINENLSTAFKQAYEADSISAFGGIVGFNREVDPETATEISKYFLECVVAPEFHSKSLEILKAKKNLRLLTMRLREVSPLTDFDYRAISGGLLVQEKNTQLLNDQMRTVTKREPSEKEWASLKFAWTISKFVKSNAVVLAYENRILGIGSGQTSRVDSLKTAIWKIRDRKMISTSTAPLVLASDGFFPFADSILEAATFGVSAIIQPGGSIRDEETITAANEKGLAMVFTGMRHFLH